MEWGIIQQAPERLIFPQSNGRHPGRNEDCNLPTVFIQPEICASSILYCLSVARMRTAHLLLTTECVHFISAKAFCENVCVKCMPAASVLDSISGQAEVKMAFYATL